MQFVDCVGLLASKTGGDLDALIARLGAAGGPCANGVTAAEAVRFHDDVSSYTGAPRVEQGRVLGVWDCDFILQKVGAE